MSYEIFFIGLIVSLIFIALTGYYPGGIIVPSYLVLFIDQPYRLVGTIIIALIAWGLYKLVARYFILYGKRRFVIILLIGSSIAFLSAFILPRFLPEAAELKVIGWVIPGLLANQLEKQGPLITLSSLAIVLLILFLAGKLFYMII